MIGLLDVNVLVALFDAAHVHHERAQAWLSQHRSAGWATCPLTQNGCVRILSQPRYPGMLPVSEVTRRLGRALQAPDHTFWPDTVSLCDPGRFTLDQINTPRSLTDLYLLALAVEHGGRLVTFDRTIVLAAVTRADSESMVVL